MVLPVSCKYELNSSNRMFNGFRCLRSASSTSSGFSSKMLPTPYLLLMRTRSAISSRAQEITASVSRNWYRPTNARAFGFAHWVKSMQPFDGSMRMMSSPFSKASAMTICDADDLPLPLLPLMSRCGVVFVSQYTGLPKSSTPIGNLRRSHFLAAFQSAMTLVGNGLFFANTMEKSVP